MNALEASGLSKRYGKKWALENCSFELPAGSIAGLVGPNGAGKTTLLHIAVGLLEPTRGSLRILGEQPGAAHVLSRVGFVAQETPLYKSFSVGDMLSFGAHMNDGFDTELARARFSRDGTRSLFRKSRARCINLGRRWERIRGLRRHVGSGHSRTCAEGGDGRDP